MTTHSPPPKKKLRKFNKPSKKKENEIIQDVVENKVYTIRRGSGSRGVKIVLYGNSGLGKTTLATLAPDPVFVAADDGISEIVHPVTGKDVPFYDAHTYRDVRAILSNPELFKGFKTIVLDTMTEVENLSIPHILDTVKTDKGRSPANIEGYGWGAGYTHVAEHDGFVRSDLQRLVNLGFNVIVICQSAPRREVSAVVDDYLKEGPKLVQRPGVKAMAATDFVEWADHCLRLGYNDLAVAAKRVTGSKERVVFAHPDATFDAKSRTLPIKYAVVSFEDKTDDSIWQLIFNKAWENDDEE